MLLWNNSRMYLENLWLWALKMAGEQADRKHNLIFEKWIKNLFSASQWRKKFLSHLKRGTVDGISRTSGKSAEYALFLINIACKTIKYCLWVINLSWSQYDQIGIKIVGSAMIIMKWKSASSIKPSLKIKRDLQLLVLTTLPILYLDNLKLHLPWKIICYMHWRTKSCEDTSRKLWRSTIEICCHQTFTWVYYLFVDSFPVEWALLN